MNTINTIEEFKTYNVYRVYYENGKILMDIRDGETYELTLPIIDVFIYYNSLKDFRFIMHSSMESVFTEDFYKAHAKEIVDAFGGINYMIDKSRAIFEYCLENKLFKYIFQSSEFEEWFYEYLSQHDEELGEEYFEEFEKEAMDLIESFGEQVPKTYAYSRFLLAFVLDNTNSNLFDSFSHTTYNNFDDNGLKLYFDRFYKFYNGVPGFLSNSKAYFEYIKEKGRDDLFLDFRGDFLTDDIIEQHKSEYEQYIFDRRYVPTSLRNKPFVREYLYNNKLYDLMMYSDIIPSLEYFDNEEFYNFFINSARIGASSKSRELLNYFLDRKEYDFAIDKFDADLFDLSVIKNYPDIFEAEKAYRLRYRVKFDIDVLDYFINGEDFFYTPVDFFSDEVLYDGMIKYPEKMFALILEKISDFRYNYSALSFVLEEKRYDYLEKFDKNLMDDTLLEEHGEELLKYLEKLKDLPYFFKTQIFFDYFIKNKKFGLLSFYDNDYFTDEIIDAYAQDILLGFGDKFPFSLKVDKLFEKAIEFGYYDLAMTYKGINDEFVEKYFDQLVKGKNIADATTLTSNKLFVRKCIENDIPNLFDFINDKYITDEMVSKHIDTIIEILNGDNKKHPLFYSSAVFRYVLDNGMNSYLNMLYPSACDDEYVLKHIDTINELSLMSLPRSLYSSAAYLKYCIDNNKKDFVLEFSKNAYESLGEEYYEKIIPYLSIPFECSLSWSSKFLTYLLDKREFSLINGFDRMALLSLELDCMLFPDDSPNSYDKYLDILYEYALSNGIPDCIKCDSSIVDKFLDNEQYALIEQFDSEAFYDSDISLLGSSLYTKLAKYVEEYNNGVVPSNLIMNKGFRKYCFENKKEDLFLQFVVNFSSEEMLKRYAKKLNFTYEEFKNKIDYLLTRNDELFNTVLPRMFENKMNVIAFRHLEKIMLYPDLQAKLIRMNENQLNVMSKVFDVLDSDNYDFTGVVVSIINNLDKYSSLVDNIDFTTMSNEEISRLLTVLSRSDNLYGISDVSELSNANYKKVKKKYFSDITKKIKNNSITLEELKIALLEKKFGLSFDQVKFLVERYCHALDDLKDKNFDNKKYTILKEINRIYQTDDITLLKFLYINSRSIEVDFYASVSLESSIRQEFAKIYSDTLYKVKGEHKVENDTELKENNSEVYNILTGLTYNDKKIPVYIMDGDFRLQIHALGAYRDWERPDNFKNDWERPKIAYHGICTSYIANNQIANARAKHPILGFDNYSSNSLLCAGNYDLFSDYAINRYDTSMYLPYKFYLPDEMINNTRHTHNEMVIERRSGTFKRLPNYVVMLVDDINNLSNYDGELWDEYCQAAHDYDVPIVIVDRLKYAKLERERIDQLEQKFYNTYDRRVLEEIVLEFSNNMIGCTCFDDANVCEYNRVFSLESFNELVSRIVDNLVNLKDEKVRLKMIKCLYSSLKKEADKGGKVPSLVGITQILENAGVSLSNDVDTVVNTYDNERIINEYYYNADDDVQERIEEDFKNNVSLEMIIAKIKDGSYEGGLRL